MENENQTVVLVSKNLMFLPRIEAAAGSTMKVRRLTDVEQPESLVQNSEVKAILVDLEEDPEIWIPVLKELKARLKSRLNKVTMVAYGPHEDEHSMDKARSLGCDPVLPKGAFINQLRNILHPKKETA